MRTSEELSALIEGKLSTASGKDELVKLATRLIVEEALEGEANDTLGRDYYEHGAGPGRGYRNGYRTGRFDKLDNAVADLRTMLKKQTQSWTFRHFQNGSEGDLADRHRLRKLQLP